MKSQGALLEEEVGRLSASSSRISSHVNRQDASTRLKVKALKDNDDDTTQV